VLLAAARPACRFEPSCSPYAIEAIARRGVIRGAGSPARIGRCHPWGGFRLRPGALRSDVDRNLLLAFALSFVVLSVWTMMQPPPHPKPPPRRPDGGRAAPTAPSPSPGSPVPARCASAEPRSARRRPAAVESIAIERPLYLAELSSQGAALRDWELTQYRDRHGDPIRLASRDDALATAATPFDELALGDLSQQVWRVESRSDTEVRFAGSAAACRAQDLLILRRRIRFQATHRCVEPQRRRRSHRRSSSSAAAPARGQRLPRAERSALHVGKVQRTPLASLGSAGFFGWLTAEGRRAGRVRRRDRLGRRADAVLSSARFPDQPAPARARFVTLEPGKRGAVQLYFDPVSLAPSQSATREYRVYFGPKEIARLEAFAPSAAASVISAGRSCTR
jgi:hypothetical protein